MYTNLDIVHFEIKGEIIGIISPHAGMIYSGEVSAYGFKAVMNKKIDTVIVVGFSHKKDYDGAITNARTLAETVMVDILKTYDSESKYKGDLTKAYGRIKSALNLDPSNPSYPDSAKQILSGLNSIVIGLATMRNEMGDAHAIRYKPEKQGIARTAN